MSEHRTRIAVTVAGHDGPADAIAHAVNRAGYIANRLIFNDFLSVFDENPWHALVVAVGPKHDIDRQRLLAWFERNALCPVLAVFPCNQQNWDNKIIDRCTEFAGWPCDDHELGLRLARVIAGANPMPANDHDRGLLDDFLPLNMVGTAPVFVDVLRLVKKLARCDASVLIQGETGTGKEVAARAIHYLSPCRDYPFIPVNCGALPDNLIENELFGHEKGAFTDARQASPGVISLAHKGTLFLDELDTLSFKAQVALLRFLQDQRYRPVGGGRLKQADVRVIAATNTDLTTAVRDGRFREDLYYRLNVAGMRMPALRERAEDVPLLAEHFMRRLRVQYHAPNKYIHPLSLLPLSSYDWPGNVRELENVIHRAFILNDGDAVHITPTGADTVTPAITHACFKDAKEQVINAFEKQYLDELLIQTGGNVSLAARCARKERRALGKLLRKHGIEAEHYRRKSTDPSRPFT